MKDFEIRCDESRLETTNLIYGKFTLGPFLPGQATTFGNALRRSLLAELSGLAITAFEIIGVMQEFSTLPGLRESILDLSLNLKQIVLTGVLPHSTPPIGFLNVRGPAIIKATDLKLPAGVYCASPNQYIATLGSNGMLHLKFVVSVGKGYSIQPYSIYRSLSKVKLQPASNFDNTTAGGNQALDYARQVPLESFKDVNLSSEALNPIPLESKGYNKETPSLLRPLSFVNSKESDVQSKEVLRSQQLKEQEQRSPERANLSASSYRDNINSLNRLTNPKTKKEELSSISIAGGAKSNEGLRSNVEHAVTPKGSAALFERTNFQTFNSNSVITSRNGKDSLISFADDLPPVAQRERGGLDKPDKSKNRRVPGTATICNNWQSKEGFTKQRGQEQALSYKASSSAFFTNEKNSAVYPFGVKASSYTNIQTQLFQRITPHQVLPIDAVFTPVSQVNFLTEVNDRFETARENIVLEIWTNGSIHPKRALEEATLSLVQNFDTLLKKIQQASSFYKGLRYWTYLQPFKSSLGEKTNGFSVNSLTPDSALQAQKSVPNCQRKVTNPEKVKDQKGSSSWKSTEGLSAAQTPNQRAYLAGGQEQKGQRLNENLLLQQHEGFSLQQREQDLEEELPEKLFKKDLPQSIYNLDIGNLNLSLQTFIFLKKAKIHTLLQLLTQFSLKQNNILPASARVNPLQVNSHLESNLLNENIIKELNDVIRQFGSED